jgi:hypothetical protein
MSNAVDAGTPAAFLLFPASRKPQIRELAMTYLAIVDSPTDLTFHRTVNERLGTDHPGFIARFAGMHGDTLRVVSVWESKSDADRFFAERLMPLVRELAGGQLGKPEMSELDVVDYTIVSRPA